MTDFGWTRFYMEFADKLLARRDDRLELVKKVQEVSVRVTPTDFLSNDEYQDGTKGPFRDVCPFTTMASFNRKGVSDDDRYKIAQELGRFLGVSESPPDSFKGIPIYHTHGPRFMRPAKDRGKDDIDVLWKCFASAIDYANKNCDIFKNSFTESFTKAIRLNGVGWNLTLGLFLMRPYRYLPLYDQTRVRNPLKELELEFPDKTDQINGIEYLNIVDTSFKFTVSIPDLIRAVYESEENEAKRNNIGEPQGREDSEDGETPPYTIQNIIDDGCFLDLSKLQTILTSLEAKQNLILQGPPGTGKTWLANKLAFALIGQKDDARVRRLQFHPNLSYEDFVRGYRPDGGGGLTLVDGLFLKQVKAAEADLDNKYVIVIEEINRGNPAQIFGEMLTLLEADKRNAAEALSLAYPRCDGERVHIPPNVYVIGTMNLADRSIALVDLALRRRFAFVDLEPVFGEVWRSWVHENFGVEDGFLQKIERRMTDLNNRIANDRSLGPQFRVGHSFVTPAPGTRIGDPREWFAQVVETEIAPLLDEYWSDNIDKANEEEKSKLLNDL